VEQCRNDLKSLTLEMYEVDYSQPAFLEVMGIYERSQTNDLIKSVVIYEKDTMVDGIYLVHHKEAIERGSIIIKIFIVSDNEIKEYYNKIQAFDEAGVETYIVRRESIGPDSRLLADFLLYKNIVAISTTGPDGMLSRIKITAQPHDFEDYKHRFEELLKLAHPFSEFAQIA